MARVKLGNAMALGNNGINKKAVAAEMTAVKTFTNPSSQYLGVNTVTAANKCVVPHEKKTTPSKINILKKGASRLLYTK